MEKDNNESFAQNSVSAKDSDSEESFVKKVKSRVSGFIPSSLSKWFGSAEKANIRTRDEVENDEESYQIQPPSKRVKRPSSENSSKLSEVSGLPEGRTLFVEPLPGPSGVRYKKASPSISLNNIYSNNIGLDKDSDDEESTSGYSSMARIGSKERQAEAIKPPIRKLNPKRDISTTEGTPERSLFLETNWDRSANTSLSSRRPSFNTSFGSPNFIDKTLSTKRIINSPFYKGRTIYGGAAAYTSRFMPQTKDNKSLMSSPLTMKPTNEPVSNGNITLSKTAKRILDTLEQFTTPISDAKKIPNPSLKNKEGLLSKYTGVNPYLVREPKPASSKELQVPTVPDLLKMKLKEKLQDSTVNVRQIATSSSSVLNVKEYTIPTTLEVSKHTNKIRNKITSTRKRKEDDEPAQVSNLPDVQLPITSLPKFDFVVPMAEKPAKPSSNSEPSTSSTPLVKDMFKGSNPFFTGNTSIFKDVSKPPEQKPTVVEKLPEPKKKSEKVKIIDSVIVKQKSEYKFTKPRVITENVRTVKAINNFVFSEPISKKESSNKPAINFSFKPVDDTNVTLRKNTRRVNGEHTELVATGSVMDILSKSNHTQGFGTQFKMGADKWECSSCMVRNNNSESKCIACSTPRTDTANAKESKCSVCLKNVTKGKVCTSCEKLQWTCKKCNKSNANDKASCQSCLTPKPDQNSLASLFKTNTNTWECSSCMIRNDNKLSKCAACESLKPIAKTQSFGDKFKAPSNTWECGSCMIRNGDNLSKCAACETPKPGAIQTTSSSFGSQFKPASNTWECSTCMIRNDNNVSKCAACETPKPIGKPNSSFSFGVPAQTSTFGNQFKPPSDTWECSTCMIRNENKLSKCAACETPKPEAKSKNTFTFGVPTQNKSLADQFKPASNTWECSSCMIRNDNKLSKCAACESPKPADKSQNNLIFCPPKTNTTNTFGEKFKPSVDTWECGSCMIRNDNKLTKCAACETPKPTAFGEQLKTKPTEWECSACMVKNPDSKTSCVCCSNPKPNQSAAPPKTTSSTSSLTFTFGIGGKTNAQGFTFGIKPSENKPIESSKTNISEVFGDSRKPATTTTGSFVFGVPSKPATEEKTQPFQPATSKTIPTIPESTEPTELNGPSSKKRSLEPSTRPEPINGGATSTTVTSVPTFNFTPKPSISSTPSNSPKPLFGSTESPLKPTFSIPAPAPSEPPKQPNPSFVFNAPPKTDSPAPASIFGSAPTPATTNLFGSQPNKVAEKPPEKVFAFGSSAPATEEKVPTFAFGQSAKNDAKPMFNFNPNSSNSSEAGSKLFSFGGTPKQPSTETATPLFGSTTQLPQNGGFNFGSNSSLSTAPKTGFNFGTASQFGAPSSTPAFNFGASTTTTPGASGFNFGSVPTTTPAFNFSGSGNPVSFTATGGPEKPTRIIKRAMRRSQR